jgi:hypothetical protein
VPDIAIGFWPTDWLTIYHFGALAGRRRVFTGVSLSVLSMLAILSISQTCERSNAVRYGGFAGRQIRALGQRGRLNRAEKGEQHVRQYPLNR